MGIGRVPKEGMTRSMRRFFIPDSAVSGNTVVITGEDAHHIKNVLRMKAGDTISVVSGCGNEYTCKITGTEADIEAVIIDFSRAASELPCSPVLFQCLPKKEKMEFVIQKAVELGVSEIVPVFSERTIVKMDEKKAVSRVSRWNAIAKSAAEQSRRSVIPEVKAPVSFKKALDISAECDIKIMPYENAEGMDHTRKLIGSIRPGMTVGVLIGPEGGFSEAEVGQARDAGFETVTLGRRILRTETAGMTALSFIIFGTEQ